MAKNDEDVLMYAIFPQVAGPFLERRAKGELTPENPPGFQDVKEEASAEEEAAEPRPAPRARRKYSMWKLAGRAGIR